MGWPFEGKDGLIEKVYLPHFHKHGEAAIPNLVNSSVSRMAFLSAYKSLPPISQMPDKEKQEMKKFVNELFPGTPARFRLQACQVIYTLGTLL